MKKLLLFYSLLIGIVSAQVMLEPMMKRRASASAGYFTTGSFTGNGVDNRAITGIGFQPDMVVIKSSTAVYGVWRTSVMGADSTAYLANAVTHFANGIESFETDGFTVGNDTTVNGNGAIYYWSAWRNNPGYFIVGKYLGNNTDNRWIAGLGFAPDLVFIQQKTTNRQEVKTRAMGLGDSCKQVPVGFGMVNNNIQAFGVVSDSFQIGTAEVNTNNVFGYYFAAKIIPNYSANALYTGNGSNQSFTLGFQPNFIFVFPHSTSSSSFKHSSQTTNTFGMLRNVADGTALTIDVNGFSTNNNTNTNANGTLFDYYAWKNQ